MFISPFHVPQTDLPKLSKPHTRGCARSVKELGLLLRADLWRYEGNGRAKWLKLFLFNPGYRYTALMRVTGYLKTDKFNRFTLYPLFKMILLRQRHILGMAIAEYADIGPGLFVTRFGGIYINGDCIIGANVNLSPMILFGQTNRGATIGSPVIGNRVFVASGARITGPITLGSDKGSAGYINRQVPDDMLRACAVERRKQGGPEAVWYPADMRSLPPL
jgi:serine O-acetyltransferase